MHEGLTFELKMDSTKVEYSHATNAFQTGATLMLNKKLPKRSPIILDLYMSDVAAHVSKK